MGVNRLESNLTTLGALALALLAVTAAPAAAQDLLWTRQIGTAELDWGIGVAADHAGNTYIIGDTRGSLGGPSAGAGDIFLSRYDASGAVLWTRQLGTSRNDYAGGVAVDSTGGVYITGTTRSLGGPGRGSSDVFLARFSASGTLLWLRQIGTSQPEAARAVAVDSEDNAYITGQTTGDFGGPSAGGNDAFLAKFNASGGLLWTSQTGTPMFEDAFGVAVDSDGNAYISGQTWGSLGAQNAGEFDAFLVKFGAQGDLLWKRQAGTISHEHGYSVAVDSAGNAYMAGATGGDLGGPSAGQWDVFLAKYSPSGTLLRMHQFGTGFSEIGYGLALDSEDSAYITGSYGIHNVRDQDVFLSKIDVSGELLWTRRIRSNADDIGTGVTVDGAGNAYVIGRTEGGIGGPSMGSWDVFLAKYSCYADCDQTTGVGVLDIFDFLCFQNSFISGEPDACDCDVSTGAGVCDMLDFVCFQNAFVAGCP
jgi:Beta-propeller repeat